MRILITNDDGIHAPGLEACETIARALSDDIWIVAPETDQSGVSHSLSLNDPLRLREVGERHFAVKGTPTDCVIMGVRHLMKDVPDIVLSGVNRGRNCAEDVTYSGTVAGAMEGTVLGIPSFALSQAYAFTTKHAPYWETAIKHGPDLIRRVLKTGMPRDVLVNINFPDCPAEQVAGIAVVTQGKRDQELLRIDARHDGRGNPYYWIAFGRGGIAGAAAGSDLAALNDMRIAVTPLRLDLTDEPFMTKLAQAVGLGGEHIRERGAELLGLEGLLQRRPVAVAVGQAAFAIAGDEDKGQAASGQNVGDRENLLPVEIDVENGGVEVAAGGKRARLSDGTDRRGHAIAEIGQHVLQQHADEIFVLDDEYAFLRFGRIVHRLVPALQLRRREPVPSPPHLPHLGKLT